MILQTKDKRIMNDLREFPKYCIDCCLTEPDVTLISKKMRLKADGRRLTFTVWVCEEHKNIKPKRVNEIVSDNINLANF
jgi:hypothetical protein